MAWIIDRKRTGKNSGKPPYLSVHWRDHKGKQRSRNLKTTDRRVAEFEKARIEREVEGRADAPVAMGPLEALDRFLLDLEQSAQSRPPTIQYYRERLEPIFVRFAGTPLTKWNRAMLKEYVIGKREWSPRTRQMTVNACKRFITWCREDAKIECADFVENSKGLVPTVRPKSREVYSLGEMALLCREVRGIPFGNRWIDLALNLAYWGGLSLGDIRSLEWKHIDLKEGTLRKCRQKTGEMIAVPLAEPLRRALLRHPGISGLVVPYFPKSDTSARKSLARKVENAGIAKRSKGEGGWHLFRHSIGSALDYAGASESVIDLVLGHSPRTMTRRYIHADLSRAREAMERLEKDFYKERLELLRPRLEARQERREAS